MALARWVLTANITLPADVLALVSGGFGSSSGTDAAGHYGAAGATWPKGTVIYADSAAGSSGSQLLYQAIGAGNLRAYVQGQDDVGHAALAN
jgi:hypothetical protein